MAETEQHIFLVTLDIITTTGYTCWVPEEETRQRAVRCVTDVLHLLLQSVFLLLIHFYHDFIFLLEDLELGFNMTLLTFYGRNCMLQLLVVFCYKKQHLLRTRKVFRFLRTTYLCSLFLIKGKMTKAPSRAFLAFSSFSSLVMKRSRSSSTTVRVVWTWAQRCQLKQQKPL